VDLAQYSWSDLWSLARQEAEESSPIYQQLHNQQHFNPSRNWFTASFNLLAPTLSRLVKHAVITEDRNTKTCDGQLYTLSGKKW